MPTLRNRVAADVPSLDLDLYGREAIADPQAAFATIRAAGAVVWLRRHRIYAIGRYADVKAALRDDGRLVSGHGVAANPVANALGRRTVLSSDADVHRRRRKVMSGSLSAKALEPLGPRLQSQADALVERLVGRRTFDGVGDFARHLPVDVIADLVGVRVEPDHLLRWGRLIFDALGPMNGRALRAVPSSVELRRYTQRLERDGVTPGSWAASVFDAADRGELSLAEARTMIIDFVVPSLDTTILAAGQMLWQLGQHPEVWRELVADPELIPAAVIESVRLASPVRAFTRRVAEPMTVGGVALPVGARVVLLYGAANGDETQFPHPERFDLHRPPGGHLGWGNGPHTCVGMHLAKLEMQTLLHAMVPRVSHIHSARPRYVRNNCLQGLEGFEARFDR
jgi:cytochrome P450